MTPTTATTAPPVLMTAEEFVRKHGGDYAELVDGIVEHFLLHHPGEVTPSFPARLKDNLLRGFRF